MKEFDCFFVIEDLKEQVDCFPNPFEQAPHSIAQKAAVHLQKNLDSDRRLSGNLWSDSGGKMFGVLVALNEFGVVGYLAAFSGMLENKWIHKGFVPPVFDVDLLQQNQRLDQNQLDLCNQQINDLELDPSRIELQRELTGLKLQAEQELSQLKFQNRQHKILRDIKRTEASKRILTEDLINALASQSQRQKSEFKIRKQSWLKRIANIQDQLDRSFEIPIQRFKASRKLLSQKLHQEVFDSYQLINQSGKTIRLSELFDGDFPPGGAADCAAPKLFQFAYKKKYKPLALAEFWWGSPQKDELRFSGHFYPPCRSKCASIIPFYLEGIEIEDSPEPSQEKLAPEIVFEDDYLLVLNKPAGMLSIPGKKISYSVASWLSDKYPEVSGPMLVHRLDMATSGLLLAAKKPNIPKHLQKQFMQRSLEKRYVAILSKAINLNQQTIQLPLRVNLDDRPRQMVCYQYGKVATTDVEIINTHSHTTRVYLYPRTGRTHQLRVHAVHPDGLNASIQGDVLYGEASDRLYLHAERIRFEHPMTGQSVQVKSTVPF